MLKEDIAKVFCFYKQDGSPFYYAKSYQTDESGNWECHYYSTDMVEVAVFSSREDTLFLNSAFLFNRPELTLRTRAKRSKFGDIYKFLMSRAQQISEYTSI